MKLSKKLFILSSALIAPATIATPTILSSCSEEDPNKLFTWNMDKTEINLKWTEDGTGYKATVNYQVNLSKNAIKSGWQKIISIYYPEMPDDKELAKYLSIQYIWNTADKILKINFAIGWKQCKGIYIYKPLIKVIVGDDVVWPKNKKTFKVQMPALTINYSTYNK